MMKILEAVFERLKTDFTVAFDYSCRVDVFERIGVFSVVIVVRQRMVRMVNDGSRRKGNDLPRRAFEVAHTVASTENVVLAGSVFNLLQEFDRIVQRRSFESSADDAGHRQPIAAVSQLGQSVSADANRAAVHAVGGDESGKRENELLRPTAFRFDVQHRLKSVAKAFQIHVLSEDRKSVV